MLGVLSVADRPFHLTRGIMKTLGLLAVLVCLAAVCGLAPAADTKAPGGQGARRHERRQDSRDRDTWLYPECEVCGKPTCEKHSSEIGGKVVCDRCRREIEEREQPVPLIDLGIRSPSERR